LGNNIYRKKDKKTYSRVKRNSFFYKKKNEIKKLFFWNNWYNIVFFVLFFIVPFYPTFASFTYNNNQYDFLRDDIDETSIIWSFYAEDNLDEENNENMPILEASDSFLSINSILNDERDLSWTNEIVNYEIKPWDNISSIAYKFKVSNNSIYWANNFSKKHIIHPWDIIKIPPTSWLIHQIKKWDNIAKLSKYYWISKEKILEQNLLTLEDNLNVWDVLVIPGAVKKVITPSYKTIPKKYYSKKVWWKWYSFSKYAKSEYVNAWWKYKLVRRKPKHRFYWWNCTRYVAQYKNVNWWWNANQWLKNAKAKWQLTWNVPKLWSIVVFNWRWYNPRYWHVWIVMDILSDKIIISDMNYRRLNEITYRKIPKTDRAIKWYIYVD